jgi:glutaryl-CoA dehydrogenase (non-decarboxylating)
MDFDLTPEQEIIRSTARQFTDEHVMERAKENDRNEHFDLELVSMMAKQGYLGSTIPKEYGGAGLDYKTYALLTEEIGRARVILRALRGARAVLGPMRDRRAAGPAGTALPAAAE